MYNMGIHDCINDQGHMFLFGEDIAKRDLNAGSPYTFKPTSRETEITHELQCTQMAAGQNKNQTVFSFLAHMQWSGTYDVINHKYLVRGHTLLENDDNFSQIEKGKKGVVVLLPMDWCTIIIVRETNLRKPLRFVQTKDDFFSKINSHL